MGFPQRREYQPGREQFDSGRQPRPYREKERVRLEGKVIEEEESGFARQQELEKLPLNDRERRILVAMGELPDESISDPTARAEAQEKLRQKNAPPKEEDFIYRPKTVLEKAEDAAKQANGEEPKKEEGGGIFSPQKVAKCLEWIKTRQERSADQLATFRGMILEYIFRKNIEINNWGGRNIVTSRTVPYDDMRNFTDFVEIWDNEDGSKSICGIDMTTSENSLKIESKLKLIEEDLLAGRMSKLDFFIDTSDLHPETVDGKTEWQGKKVGYLERFPRVVIALGKENTQALVNDQVHDWEVRQKNEGIREYNRLHPDSPKQLEKQVMPTNMSQIHYLEQHRDQLYWQAEVCLRNIFDTINARYNEVFDGTDAKNDGIMAGELKELLAEVKEVRYDETRMKEVAENLHHMGLYQKLKTVHREGTLRPDLSRGKSINYKQVDLNEQLENLDTIMKVLGIVNDTLREKTYPDPNAEGSLGLTMAQIDEPRRQKNIIRRIIRRKLSGFTVPSPLEEKLKVAA